MRVKHTFLILAIAAMGIQAGISQSRSISDVVEIQLRNMGPILNDTEVMGYYLFFQTDKLDKKTLSYEVVILDQNLNEISSQALQGSKYLTLVDGVYNNSALILKLYDLKEKEFTFRIYDNDAREFASYTRAASKLEAMFIDQAQKNKEGQNLTIFPIKELGFVDYRSEKQKKYGYVIDFYPSMDGGKKWTVKSDKESRENEFATFIYGDENILISSVIKKNSILSNQVEVALLAVDARTGKKMYEKPIKDPQYELLVLNGLDSDAEGNLFLFGNYFPKGKNELTNPSLGLFAAKLDKGGNVLEKNFISWEKDVSEFVDVNNKGKMKDVGYVFFHDVVRNADGNVYAIGEQYKKVMKGISTDMVIQDMMIFEMDQDYKLKHVNIIEKAKSSFRLPQGAGLNGAQLLAYYAKANGGFDYEFIQFNKNRSIFSIGYVDLVNVKGDASQLSFGTITYADSKASTDMLELMAVNEKKTIRVLPAKIGNIAIFEYLPKEKKMNMRIEKTNY